MRRLLVLFAFFFLHDTASADEAAIAAKKRVDEAAVRVWRAFAAGTAPKAEVGRERSTRSRGPRGRAARGEAA